MKKKLVAIILVLALSLGLTACAGGSTTPEKVELPQYKVGVILYNLSNDWALNIMKSIEYLGSNLNVTFDYAVGGTDGTDHRPLKTSVRPALTASSICIPA